jgi:hypothetical protein
MWRDPEDSFVWLNACSKQLSDRPIELQVLMKHSHWNCLTSCVVGEESVFVTCWVYIEIKKFANPCRSIVPSRLNLVFFWHCLHQMTHFRRTQPLVADALL